MEFFHKYITISLGKLIRGIMNNTQITLVKPITIKDLKAKLRKLKFRPNSNGNYIKTTDEHAIIVYISEIAETVSTLMVGHNNLSNDELNKALGLS